MAISFRDVGIKQEERNTDVLSRNRSQIPIGLKTPLQLDPSGRNMLSMNYNIKDQIKDNLKNLLLTNHGERVAQHNFGGNLRPIVTEYTNKEDFDTEAMLRINTAISKWMPFVNPVEFESRIDRQDNQIVGKVIMLIVYSVPSLNVSRDEIEIEFSII